MSSPAQGSGFSDKAISDALTDLALDLRWSFNHSADQLWEQLDPEFWELTHNPWVMLQTISEERLRTVTSDPKFQRLLADLHREQTSAEASPGWFQRAHPHSGVSAIAYFSMEFMLSEALPIYSGGLGNVAGDQLKTASNLCVPVIGVSLLYQQGYFRQEIDAQGHQQALYPFNDPGQLPSPCGRQMASGCAFQSIFPAVNCGSVHGRFEWAERNCICWIRMIPRTFPRTAELRRSSMAVVRSCG